MKKLEAEGGCGVMGFACAEKVAGRHLLPALTQMRNRGNGKGGGIAAAGLAPEQFGVTQAILDNDYLLAIAYLDINCRQVVERDYIYKDFEIDHVYQVPHIPDYKTIQGLDVQPPEVVIYFGRIKTDLHEDEAVYRFAYKLNCAFYSSTGDKRAFALSHGKNLLVLKMVGYGDDVIRYYKLENLMAYVWIGHHRYPTKERCGTLRVLTHL